MNIYIIGIGLIGGSMALDIKSIYDDATIFGIDANEKHLEEAINLGIIDQKATENDLINADLVIVAVPVDVALVILP
jgi:prephenate dehydrogenase